MLIYEGMASFAAPPATRRCSRSMPPYVFFESFTSLLPPQQVIAAPMRLRAAIMLLRAADAVLGERVLQCVVAAPLLAVRDTPDNTSAAMASLSPYKERRFASQLRALE